MSIIGIVAIAENYAIGKDRRLPWHYSADLKHFKATTMGNCLVMGAITWRSIGRALPGRLNVVLSRSGNSPGKAAIRLQSREEVLEVAKYLKCDVFIIGGAKTYQSFANTIDEWVVTRVPITVEDADVFMPKDFLKGFTLVDSRKLDEGLTVEFFRRTAD